MKKIFLKCLMTAAFSSSLEAGLKIDAAFIFDFMQPSSNVYYVRERLPYEQFHFNQPFYIDSTRYNSLEMQEILFRHPNGQGIILDVDYSPREIDRLVSLFHERLTIYADRSPSMFVLSWLRSGAIVQANALYYSGFERRRMESFGTRFIYPNTDLRYPNRIYFEGSDRGRSKHHKKESHKKRDNDEKRDRDERKNRDDKNGKRHERIGK